VPELPEVETTARSLHRQVAGDVIESVWIGDKTNLLKSPAEEIARTLKGSRIDGVRRVGKHIVIDIHRDRAGDRRRGTIQSTARAQWVVHLGMTGRMLVCDPAAERAKHTHLVAQMASGRELRFVDPRRFGKLQVISEGSFQAPGSEPIGANREAFAKLFQGRKTPIKSALLNQKLLSGIGNIYADESLFRAAIRPRRRAASLTRAELSRRRSRWFFSAPASRLRTRGRGLRGVQDSHQANRHRRTQQPLLSQVPEMKNNSFQFQVSGFKIGKHWLSELSNYADYNGAAMAEIISRCKGPSRG
jgi:formamidopyrimidine-DNA glycosylase